MKVSLDFKCLPAVQSTSILEGLDRDLICKMQELDCFPETLDRARGAAVLFHCASAQHECWRDEAFIRAGLADFSSMNDSLVRDLRQAGRAKARFNFRDSENPLIHLMWLLRNINIHASRSQTETAKATVVSRLGSPHEYSYSIPVIVNLSTEHLLERKETRKYYHERDLVSVVEWFNQNQRKFGAPDLLVRGVECRCNEMLELYS